LNKSEEAKTGKHFITYSNLKFSITQVSYL